MINLIKIHNEKQSQKLFWNIEEINLNKDKLQFLNLSKAHQEMVLRNMKVQLAFDSGFKYV